MKKYAVTENKKNANETYFVWFQIGVLEDEDFRRNIKHVSTKNLKAQSGFEVDFFHTK